MQDISKPIVAVRYMQTQRDAKRVWSEGDVGEMCERYLDQAGIVDHKPGGIFLSDKAYHYFTDVPVEPGDVVIVRGGDEVKLAVVDSLVAEGTFERYLLSFRIAWILAEEFYTILWRTGN